MRTGTLPIIEWLENTFDLQPTSSVSFIYDYMESQSGEILAGIYQPFDPQKTGHIIDRAQILDYRYSVGCGRLLDFGPGDGWPSLRIAPLVQKVVGVDASAKRVEICSINAARLNIHNAAFVHVPENENLPFDDNYFDGAMAASSIEQTPQPNQCMRELFRVLKPGGRLRIFYESLGKYMGKPREIWLMKMDDKLSRLIIYDRNIEEEFVQHYGLVFNLPVDKIEEKFARDGNQVSYENLTTAILEDLRDHIIETLTWRTQHPSCRTFLNMLSDAGFSSVMPTYEGGGFVHRVLENMDQRPKFNDLAEIDEFITPLVKLAVVTEAPARSRAGQWDPMITAIK
jgi:ubiquinone/menaquinone biosynthesis C-methylase UbiE